MKKICHFSSVHRGLDIRIFRKECISLANAGYDTHLVIDATAADMAEAASHGVTVHPVAPDAQGGRLSRMVSHARHCYHAARELNADLYHFHDPELIPYGVMLARSGKKVVFDAHEDLIGDIHAKDWVPVRARHAVAAIAGAVQDFGARRFSAVVTATPFIGSLFENLAKQVVVVNNFPLLHELPPAQDVDVSQRKSVCYVGNIHKHRGIQEMVKAIGMSGEQLLLAGDFRPGLLRDEVTGYDGWQHVRECGVVDRKGVADIMAQSFAGMVIFHPVPNFINAQPIKMFEYMSAGVPVIASDFPLWRDFIEGNQCGICVDHTRPDAIADAIRHLRTHPEDVVRMGANGRRATAEKYRWDREETKLLSLYRALLEDRERSRSMRDTEDHRLSEA
ncbi:MAG TPA: glycosyltransferase [Noviherbaspirillum sp.]|uniref:glycosyltransferase n=1 Tax=Noviherbaspirillum sp. TaxID=1926288 RepID=UPI002B48CBD6|nr:glycosyltransferase [Noviherbaspirillum sp.]HJV84452.1 glycosyltransferase [Noviherbaspirillum sp.]